eukprot:1140620-Pelagomonas_calceolata.AAC.7
MHARNNTHPPALPFQVLIAEGLQHGGQAGVSGCKGLCASSQRLQEGGLQAQGGAWACRLTVSQFWHPEPAAAGRRPASKHWHLEPGHWKQEHAAKVRALRTYMQALQVAMQLLEDAAGPQT